MLYNGLANSRVWPVVGKRHGLGQVWPSVYVPTGRLGHGRGRIRLTQTSPYQYAVTVARYGITTEVSPSIHSAIYKFSFPKSDSANIMLDVSHNISDIATVMRGANSRFLDGIVTFTSTKGNELKGFGTYTDGFSDGPYNVYFVCV